MGTHSDSTSGKVFPPLIGLVFVLGLVAGCSAFPSRDTIDQMFTEAKTSASPEVRDRAYGRILKKLSTPRTVEHDAIIEYAVQRMIAEYKRTQDEAIAQSIDAVHLDGGFGTTICGFYSSVWAEKKFLARYSALPDARHALNRCVGISLSEAEFETISKGLVPQRSSDSL